MKSVLCLSGGLDSTVAYFYLKSKNPSDEMMCVYVDLNTKYTNKEITVLEELRRKFGVETFIVRGPDMGRYDADQTGYVRFRNLFLAELAAQYGTNIWIVGVKGDKVVDKSPEAFRIMTDLLNEVSDIDRDGPVKIDSPFWTLTKAELVKLLLRLEGKDRAFDILQTSSSCYHPTLLHCGECPSCFRKWIALEAAGIPSVSWFRADIRKYNKIPEYIDRMKVGTYDAQRTAETVLVLAKYECLPLEAEAQVRPQE